MLLRGSLLLWVLLLLQHTSLLNDLTAHVDQHEPDTQPVTTATLLLSSCPLFTQRFFLFVKQNRCEDIQAHRFPQRASHLLPAPAVDRSLQRPSVPLNLL